MTASAPLQAALVAAGLRMPELSGVFDGPPARADFPYLVVDCGSEKDWSCQSHDGREIEVVLTLWDDRPSRLFDLEGQLEAQVGPIAVDGAWRLASFRFLHKKKERNPAGPWACSLTFRARLLQTSEER